MTKKKRTLSRQKRVKKTASGEIIISDSVELFLLEFLKNGGSVGKAALTVGNFTSLKSAAVSGSRWLKEAKERGLIRHALEKKGYSYGKMMDVALEKMEKSKKPDWWDRVMKMANYEDFITKDSSTPNVNVNIPFFAAHKKIAEEYVTDADAEEGEIVEEPAQDADTKTKKD